MLVPMYLEYSKTEFSQNSTFEWRTTLNFLAFSIVPIAGVFHILEVFWLFYVYLSKLYI